MSDIENNNFEQILEAEPVGVQKEEKDYEKAFPYLRHNYNGETEVNEVNSRRANIDISFDEYNEEEANLEENFYLDEAQDIARRRI